MYPVCTRAYANHKMAQMFPIVQIVRTDGLAELDTRYALQTEQSRRTATIWRVSPGRVDVNRIRNCSVFSR